MRNALIIGIDEYPTFGNLKGCVNDAKSIHDVLSFHENGEKNFDAVLKTTEGNLKIEKNQLRESCQRLFSAKGEIALFYFAGHGCLTPRGGYICASDSSTISPGIEMNELLEMANNSPATNRVILLDCCNSGAMGAPDDRTADITISNGVTIISASNNTQSAVEQNGKGLFTTLLKDALSGEAADLLGNISPASVYNYIDKLLSWDQQRPLFKTNISHFVSLRSVETKMSSDTLRKIIAFFVQPDHIFPLNPSFEPTSDSANEENVQVFKILQSMVSAYLVEPVDAPHMYAAAMDSKSCRLTRQGKAHWRIINAGRI